MFYEDVTNLNFELVVNRTYILNDAGECFRLEGNRRG